MKYALLSNGTSGTVTATDGSQKNGYIEAPDTVECGWQLNGEIWEKGATLVATEALAAALLTKRQNVTNAIETLRTWVTHAKDTVVAGWDTASTSDKLAAVKQHIDRDATVWSRLADLVEGHKLN